MAAREQFSSRLTTILTMVGVAVGLGNVWRFPYMMGEYGGTAFLVVYLIFTLLFAIPAMMAEWALGRETRQGPIGAFSAVWGPRWGRRIGALLVFTIVVSVSYYIVVIGNILFAAGFSVMQGFDATSLPRFERLLANGLVQYGCALAVLAGCLIVLHRGLHRGIEAVSRLFVPFFGVVILYLVINAFMLEGASDRFAAFLRPDFSVIAVEQVFAALGQAFFSLGLAGTIMVIYGSYLRSDHDIGRAAVATAAGDVGAAVVASLFIVPTILAFDLDLAQGPTLIFETLPRLFGVMPGGRPLGSAFLLALCLIAFLSALGTLEAIVGGIDDEVGARVARSRILVAVGLVEAALMLPSSLDPEIVGTLDLIFGSGMQMFGSVMAVTGVAWGLGRTRAMRQMFGGETTDWHGAVFLWIRWAVPGCLLIVLTVYVISQL